MMLSEDVCNAIVALEKWRKTIQHMIPDWPGTWQVKLYYYIYMFSWNRNTDTFRVMHASPPNRDEIGSWRIYSLRYKWQQKSVDHMMIMGIIEQEWPASVKITYLII